ncbi:MAG: GNAT family N-acetyltransferase [Planctomycetota bacterium]|jgi:GNAT superfamily N-acetyltransferase
MCETSAASCEELAEILAFLAERRLENAWLIWSVCDALERPLEGQRVVICRDNADLVGAACMCERREPGHYSISMDATCPRAAACLAQSLPPGSIAHFQLFTPETREFFDGLEDAERHEDDLYYTVSAESSRPMGGHEVVELTEADAPLFEGFEQQPDWEHAHAERRLFGIVLEGRVAASISCTPITPKGAGTRRVVSAGALHTQTSYRRRGLASRLLTHATGLILSEGNLPIYWTEPDNVASQRLCKSLGFWQYAQKVNYVWRMPEEP